MLQRAWGGFSASSISLVNDANLEGVMLHSGFENTREGDSVSTKGSSSSLAWGSVLSVAMRKLEGVTVSFEEILETVDESDMLSDSCSGCSSISSIVAVGTKGAFEARGFSVFEVSFSVFIRRGVAWAINAMPPCDSS